MLPLAQVLVFIDQNCCSMSYERMMSEFRTDSIPCFLRKSLIPLQPYIEAIQVVSLDHSLEGALHRCQAHYNLCCLILSDLVEMP
jgi:hypothetical protein